MNNLQNAVTVILGAPATGKTTLAKQMCLYKSTVWPSYLTGFGLSRISDVTELVVLNGMNDLKEVKRFITSPTLEVERKGIFTPQTVTRPHTIVVSNSFKPADFKDVPHATVVVLQSANNIPRKSSFLASLKHLFTSKN